MPRNIAIVEDETAIRLNYMDALRHQGYQLSGYNERDKALQAFRRKLPDLVLIDVGLGEDIDGGFELCRELRVMSRVLPIMFLTARDTDLDVISGLRLGADDYLSKDISLQHLMARIIALFRRVTMLSGEQNTGSWIERGDLRLSAERMEVQWGGQAVPLTVTELWIVHSLARYPGIVLSRPQLMDDARILVDDQTITSHIKRIRRKFKAVDESFAKLATVYGAGYRWNNAGE